MTGSFTLEVTFGVTSLTPLESTTFEIAVDTSTLGPQSGSVSFGSNDADENPFNFTVRSNVMPDTGIAIIDNGGDGFATRGNSTSLTRNGNGHLNDFQYANSGSSGHMATWAFTATPGQ